MSLRSSGGVPLAVVLLVLHAVEARHLVARQVPVGTPQFVAVRPFDHRVHVGVHSARLVARKIDAIVQAEAGCAELPEVDGSISAHPFSPPFMSKGFEGGGASCNVLLQIC